MEVDTERAYWETVDKNARQTLLDIKGFIDYLENVKRELCIASARTSSDEAIKYIGPSTEVAVAGIIHAIDYLSVCRGKIQDTDLVVTTRSLSNLESY